MTDDTNPALMTEIPTTLEGLKERVSKLFHCMDGPPQAYFELPVPRLEPKPNDPPFEFARFVYATVGWQTTQPRESAEPALVARMLDMFMQAHVALTEDQRDKPILFWRRRLTIEELHEHVLGSARVTLSCRVVIPGYDLRCWRKTEGAEYPDVAAYVPFPATL